MNTKYRFTRHAVEKAIDLGWTIDQIEKAVSFPSITYANSRPNTVRCIRDGICAVFDFTTQTIVTVHPSTRETAIRPDQMKDPRALAFEARRKGRKA